MFCSMVISPLSLEFNYCLFWWPFFTLAGFFSSCPDIRWCHIGINMTLFQVSKNIGDSLDPPIRSSKVRHMNVLRG